MKLLRTLPTRRLLLALTVIVAVAIGGSALAVAASGKRGDTPPPASLADALHSAANAPEPAGITARVKFTNNLFPSGALLGQAASPLLGGASGRLWLTNDGRGRIELQSDAGDAQVVWNAKTISLFDASTNTAYEASLPAAPSKPNAGTAPSVRQVTDLLDKLAEHWSLAGPTPATLAGRGAYAASATPKTQAGLLASVDVAWDATQGVPLRAAVTARGAAAPALELTTTDISYGPVAAADVDVAPPATAKVVHLDAGGSGKDGKEQKPVVGIAAVRAHAGFPVVAPGSLAGLARMDARLAGKRAILVYGEGLGAIVVTERKADAAAGPGLPLPAVQIGGAAGHELATQLGTVVMWDAQGVSFVLAGSVDAGQAEAAARAL